MAEIPVEKDPHRGGVPWWGWVGALVLLGGGGLIAARSCSGGPETANADGDRGAVVADAGTGGNTVMIPTAVADAGGATIAPTEVPTAQPRSDGAVTQMATGEGGAVFTDLNAYGTAADKLSFAGRSVEFSNVRVTRVLSDRVFTVTSGTGELYAMLDNALNDGTAEHRVTVQPGQLLNVLGTFRRAPTADMVDEQNRRIELPPAAAGAMRAQQVYLHVTTIRGSAVH